MASYCSRTLVVFRFEILMVQCGVLVVLRLDFHLLIWPQFILRTLAKRPDMTTFYKWSYRIWNQSIGLEQKMVSYSMMIWVKISSMKINGGCFKDIGIKPFALSIMIFELKMACWWWSNCCISWNICSNRDRRSFKRLCCDWCWCHAHSRRVDDFERQSDGDFQSIW